jgi:hypothetical protein
MAVVAGSMAFSVDSIVLLVGSIAPRRAASQLWPAGRLASGEGTGRR